MAEPLARYHASNPTTYIDEMLAIACAGERQHLEELCVSGISF